MSSLRSRFMRLFLRHFVGPRFRHAGSSIAEWRKLDQLVIRHQRLPAGVEVQRVSADGVAAEWVRARGSRSDRVVLYFHGGGFIMGSPATHRELAARLSFATAGAVAVPDYRLAPEHPFPAAVEDAKTTYRWLLGRGHPATSLAMGGDSAGGGLTVQTLIALRDEGDPLPAAAFLLSPVADWVRFDGESYASRAARDPMVTEEMCRFGASQLVGDNDPETPLLCPLALDLAGLPPLVIHVGEDEVLLSDSIRLAQRATSVGVHVELKTWPGMWHVFQTAAGLVPESRRSLEQIGRFVTDRWTAPPGGDSGPR